MEWVPTWEWRGKTCLPRKFRGRVQRSAPYLQWLAAKGELKFSLGVGQAVGRGQGRERPWTACAAHPKKEAGSRQVHESSCKRW